MITKTVLRTEDCGLRKKTTQPAQHSALSPQSLFFIALYLLGWTAAASAAPALTVGNISGQAGTTVTLPITFDPTTASVAGIQFNITLPAGLSAGTVTAGAIVNNAGKSVTTNINGTTWTFVIFGVNQNAIASGSLLTAQVTIAPGTPLGALNLTLSNVVYSDPNGLPITAGTNTNGTVTVIAPAPVINSAATAIGMVSTAFSYQITASNNPTSFNATGLPAGLSINTGTGLISGTPTTVGVSNVTLSAINAGGTGTLALTLTINPQPPVVTSAATATGIVKKSFSYQITASNTPTSFNALGLPAGLAINTASGLISGSPTTAGVSNVTLNATNAGGTGSKTLTLTVFSPCDINQDSATNVSDIQNEVNQAIGVTSCTADINVDGACNVIDIQRIVNAVLGGQCVSP